MLCDESGTRDGAVAEWVLAAMLASTKQLGEARAIRYGTRRAC